VCFVDTGSELTMVKRTAAKLLSDICVQESSRALQGVLGPPTAVTAEADLTVMIHSRLSLAHRVCIVDGLQFPGDVLLGMDVLRRFPVRLSFNASWSSMELGGQPYKIFFHWREVTAYSPSSSLP